MAISARRLRSLRNAYESAHELAFDRRKQPLPPPATQYPSHQGAQGGTTPPTKSHLEVLDERFRSAVQREFTKLGLS